MSFSDNAVSVRGLSKAYTIAHNQEKHSTLAEAVLSRLKNPLHRPKTETFWALKDVSFDIKKGDIVGIVGRNGAGKSTLLKILSRITEPTIGEIDIYGRVGSLLEVGTGFHPELTGRENVFLNGAILGMTKAEIRRQFDAIAGFAGVEKFLDTPVKRYSSGMYIRLAFAVAAHLNPEILIVDEVLAVGDSEFQKRCLGKMKDVAATGRTVIFVSHNMAAVNHLCTTALHLEGGKVVNVGDAESVVTKYLANEGAVRSSRSWSFPGDAPGDERVRLLRTQVIQNSVIAPVVDINAPFSVEMHFCTLLPVKNLLTGFSFYNAEGLCLFASVDWRQNNLAPASYVKRLEIPRHVFAEGIVTVLVQLVFFDPDVRSVYLPAALSFDAVDSNDPQSVRGAFKGHWPGVLRLGLAWSDLEPVRTNCIDGFKHSCWSVSDVL